MWVILGAEKASSRVGHVVLVLVLDSLASDCGGGWRIWWRGLLLGDEQNKSRVNGVVCGVEREKSECVCVFESECLGVYLAEIKASLATFWTSQRCSFCFFFSFFFFCCSTMRK